jgi:RecJ-like exonuclease
MGSCIICEASVEGYTCDSHDQDVVFEFEGSRADQLTPGRFYRGSVDGFADFGVFVDIGDSVTGLLHRSELDRRLESLDWDPGDTVYVQVTGIHENGNVDLAWSIRQSAGEFRGTLIDDPEGDRLDETAESAERASTDGAGSPDPNERTAATAGAAADATNASTANRSTEPVSDASGTGSDANASGATDTSEADVGSETNTGSVAGATGTTGASESGSSTGIGDAADTAEATGGADTATGGSAGGAALVAPERKRVPIEELDERIGDAVRIEGEVTSAHQTGGPTVFEVRDETGSVDCAAFEAAGVRAYPDAEAGDVVRIDGTVERHREALQIETKGLAVLSGEEHAAVEDRLEAALAAQAEPGSVEPLAEDPVMTALTEEIGAVAGAIRRAIIESRPVVVRHAATADGFLAGAAIERAVLPLVRAEHAGDDAVYHYFDRRPLDGSVYGMDDATADVSRMLDDRERHGEKLPLLVFVAAGGGRESADGLGLLDTYGVERVVIDAIPADPEIERAVDALVAPREGSDAGIDAADATGATDAADDAPPTATALATTVAATVAPEVRAELGHLPATSYWEGAPSAYADLAVEADYDAETVEEIRAAVALLSNYHAYEDKRELISDILFATAESEELAARLATQFRTRLDRAIETAVANTSDRAVGEVAFTVLDTDAFAHRYEFPPTRLLIDALHRRTRADAAVTIGLGADELHLRSTEPLSLREVAERAAERAPEAGLSARGARDGSIEFLVGEREAALEAVVQAVVSTFGPRG